MTSIVKVEAHVPKHIEVRVCVTGGPLIINEYILNDGDKGEYLVYDDQEVSVREVVKRSRKEGL